MLKGSVLKEIEEIKKRYPDRRAALLPALYIAQREFGWLSNDALMGVSEVLNLPEAMVRGTASFYAMFRHTPPGRNIIQICTNVSCMILGAERIVDFIRKRYEIDENGMSKDGRYSLVIMECIGACDMAPAMLVNEDLHGNLTEEKIVEILDRYK